MIVRWFPSLISHLQYKRKKKKAQIPDSIAKNDSKHCITEDSHLHKLHSSKRADNIPLLAINMPLHLLLNNHLRAFIASNGTHIGSTTRAPSIMRHLRGILNVVAEIVLQIPAATTRTA